MAVSDQLKSLGIQLPPLAAPIASYVPAVLTGDLLFVSGQLPRVAGQILLPGKLGEDITVEEGQAAARAAAINVLAVLEDALGDLERVTRIVRVNGYVASSPAFVDQSKVIDGASTLFEAVFGPNGRHTRIAVGVAALPLNAAVEIDVVAEVRVV